MVIPGEASVHEYDVDDLSFPTHGYLLSKSDTKWRKIFYQSIIKELTNVLLDHKVIKLISRSQVPKGAKIINSMLVFDIKRNGKTKTRWVAGGHQMTGMPMSDRYSPTANHLAHMAALRYALKHDLQVLSFDVTGAFLLGSNEETIYMSLPVPIQWYQNGVYEDVVCVCYGNLYGRPDAGNIWYNHYKKTGELEWKVSETDPCLFISKVDKSIHTIHVDDGLLVADQAGQERFFQMLKRAGFSFEITTLQDYLGMNIRKVEVDGEPGYFVSQEEYLNKILKKYGYDSGIKPAPSPMREGMKIFPTLEEPQDVTKFRSMLNSASFLRKTRFDILFVLKELAQVQNRPNSFAWNTMHRLFRYLATSRDLGILITNKGGANSNNEFLMAKCDASNNSCPVTHRSTGGALIYFSQCIFTAECKNQTLITDSSCYAEVYEVARTVKLLIAVAKILKELGLYKEGKLIPVYCDNQAALDISIKSNMSKRSRHFELYATFFKQYVGRFIEVVKVDTKENEADILTKALSPATFIAHRDKFMTSKSKLKIIDTQ
uniref:Reverse transcriptase Ty1/copia-type domain-containing protein n=1 Tax=Aplanochytrium stocchinoi TaxID=215587 RepID=A0A7S3PQJ1_9STRA